MKLRNRTERRAAERFAKKAAAKQAKLEQQQQQQQQFNPSVMTAASAAASPAPNVDFAEPESRPVSDAQFAANRANAQKSCGPVTSEGKARSSMNALKTGLTGQTVVLPSDDIAAYEKHIERHLTRYTPVGEEEESLVQSIADTAWRLLRIAPLEAAIYAIGRLENPDLFPEEKNPLTREALIRGKIFLLYRRDLSNLALQERRLRNQQKSDIETLAALQKDRRAQQTPQDDIQNKMGHAVRNFHISRELKQPFSPPKFGFEFSLDEVEFCYNAFMGAIESGEPGEPDFKALLAEFRKYQREYKAA